MKTKLKKILVIVAAMAAPALAHGQGSAAPEQAEQHSKPIELQTFIIEGKEILNVPSGIKQFPSRTSSLMKSELDSLNSLAKMQSVILPPKPLPTKYFTKPVYNGFLGAEIGLYMSPKLDAGYAMNFDGYNLFAHGGLEHSNGAVTNADFTDAFVSIGSDYTAPDKYIFFGGSRTRAKLDFRALNYNLYGLASTPHRNTNSFSLGVESAGSPDGNTVFKTGASMDMYSVATSGAEKADNSFFGGYAELMTKYNGLEFGGDAALGFNSYNESGMRIDLAGRFRFQYEKSDFRLRLGFANAKNSMGENKSAVVLGINYDYSVLRDFTLIGEISSELGRVSLRSIMLANPYLKDSAVVDFGSVTRAAITAKYHPTERLLAAATISYDLNGCAPVFASDSAMNMSLRYLQTQTIGFGAEIDYYLTKIDKINASIAYKSSSVKDFDKLTYSPAFTFGANYRRAWLPEFSTQAGLSYIGKKYTDIANTRELDAYLHISLRGDYAISEKISLNARIENLINSEIYLWDGYKERDLFFGIGLLLKF